MTSQNQPTVRIKFLAEFKQLFNESWRNFVFHGGPGSGKSRHVALALLLRGRSKKLLILCTRELQNTIADSVHKLLTDIINDYGFTDYEITEKVIRNKITGTEFIFKGLRHNATEIKSTEGIDIAWVEEAQSISEASLKVLVPTVRKAGCQLIYERAGPCLRPLLQDQRRPVPMSARSTTTFSSEPAFSPMSYGKRWKPTRQQAWICMLTSG